MNSILAFTTLLITLLWIQFINKRKREKEITGLMNKCEQFHNAIALHLITRYLPGGGFLEFKLFHHSDGFELSWESGGARTKELEKPSGCKEIRGPQAEQFLYQIRKLQFLTRTSDVKKVKDGWRSSLLYVEQHDWVKLEYISPEREKEYLLLLIKTLKELVSLEENSNFRN